MEDQKERENEEEKEEEKEEDENKEEEKKEEKENDEPVIEMENIDEETNSESDNETDIDDSTNTMFSLLLHQYRKMEKKRVHKKKQNKFIPCMTAFMKCDIPERHELYNKNKKIPEHMKFIAKSILSGKISELPKIGKSERYVLKEFVQGNLLKHEENMLIVEDVRLSCLFRKTFNLLVKMAK